MEKSSDIRQNAFISTVKCSSVIDIFYTKENQTQRGFIVLDTADEENSAHTSIYATTKTKSVLIKIRIELDELLNENLVSLEQFLGDA